MTGPRRSLPFGGTTPMSILLAGALHHQEQLLSLLSAKGTGIYMAPIQAEVERDSYFSILEEIAGPHCKQFELESLYTFFRKAKGIGIFDERANLGAIKAGGHFCFNLEPQSHLAALERRQLFDYRFDDLVHVTGGAIW